MLILGKIAPVLLVLLSGCFSEEKEPADAGRK